MQSLVRCLMLTILIHSTATLVRSAINKICPDVNNISKTCLLHYSQFTFAGSHNSGSYGRIRTRIWGIDTLPGGRSFSLCYLENQSLTIEEQLDIGVRAFDFDLTYVRGGRKGKRRGAVIVHCKGWMLCGYTGRLADALTSIKKFLDENKHDIIVIRIKDHYVRNKEERILLAQQVAKDFSSTLTYKRLNYHVDPLIGVALLQKRTVFLYLHTKLYIALKYLPKHYNRFMLYARPHKVIESWYKIHKMMKFGCDLKKDTLDFLSDEERGDFMMTHPWVPIIVDWYMTSRGRCIRYRAAHCNKTIKDAIPISKYLQTHYNRTINILLTDYTTIRAVETVKIINERNVKYFRNVEMPEGYKGHDYHWRYYPFRRKRIVDGKGGEKVRKMKKKKEEEDKRNKDKKEVKKKGKEKKKEKKNKKEIKKTKEKKKE